jgi:hypothetical protein
MIDSQDRTDPQAASVRDPHDGGSNGTAGWKRMCPECGEPAVKVPPASVMPWQAHGLAAPQWSHRDGTPLCPVIGPAGYQPAEPAAENPVPVEDDFGLPLVDAPRAGAGRAGPTLGTFIREQLALRIADLAAYLSDPVSRRAEMGAHGGTAAPNATAHEAAAAERSGGAQGIQAARTALRAIAKTADNAASSIGVLAASLADADMDPATLAEVADILEAAGELRGAAEKAGDGMNRRHAQIEQVINATQHVAKTSFYRH